MFYSDRQAATIISVSGDEKLITVQLDKSIATKPFPENEYTYERDEDGMVYTFKLIRDKWCRVIKNSATGRWNKVDYPTINIGKRCTYRDPSF